MVQTNQTLMTDTVGGVATAPPIVDSVSNVVLPVNMAITEQPVGNLIADRATNPLPIVLSIIAIVMVVGIGYMFYRLVSQLKIRLSNLAGSISELQKEKSEIENCLQEIEKRINSSSDKLAIFDGDIRHLRNKVSTLYSSNQSKNGDVEIVSSPVISQPKKNIELFFANLQAPDQNGVLRFAVRGFSSQPSPQKMFALEIDNSTGKGIYKINPEANALIVSDLQLFNFFVKPYNFSGNPESVKITTRRPGKVVKSGQFWIVEELLEITIN